MRILCALAAAALVAACTPRDDERIANIELERAPEALVHAEPTVVGGAHDSIIYRIVPLPVAPGHGSTGAGDATDAAGAIPDTTAHDDH